MATRQGRKLTDADRKRVMQVRRQRRETDLSRRRNLSDLEEEAESLCAAADTMPPGMNLSDVHLKMLLSLKVAFSKAAGEMPERADRLKLVLEVRQLLDNPRVPVHDVVRVGAIQFLVACLRDHHDVNIHFDAISALTNIAVDKAEHAIQVVEADAVVLLVEFVYLPRPDVADQAIWALGSLITVSGRVRNLALALGVMKRMMYLAGVPDALPNHRNLAFFYYTLVRSKLKPPLTERYKRQLVAGLKLLLETTNQEENVTSDVLWTLIRVCESDALIPCRPLLIEMRMIARISELLKSRDEVIVSSALRVFTLLLDEEHGDPVLSCNVINRLPQMMQNNQLLVLQQALQFICMVLERGEHHVENVLMADLLPVLLRCIVHTSDEISRMALTSIEHLCLMSSKSQLNQILRYDKMKLMQHLEQSLSRPDAEVLQITLSIMCLLLTRTYDGELKVKEVMLRNNMFTKLLEYCMHKDTSVSKAAKSLLAEFFPDKVSIVN